jgi:hypothetical protein
MGICVGIYMWPRRMGPAALFPRNGCALFATSYRHLSALSASTRNLGRTRLSSGLRPTQMVHGSSALWASSGLTTELPPLPSPSAKRSLLLHITCLRWLAICEDRQDGHVDHSYHAVAIYSATPSRHLHRQRATYNPAHE